MEITFAHLAIVAMLLLMLLLLQDIRTLLTEMSKDFLESEIRKIQNKK